MHIRRTVCLLGLTIGATSLMAGCLSCDDDLVLGQATAAPPPQQAAAPQQAAQAANPAPAVLSKRGAGLRSVLLRKVPFVRQKPDFCGEACGSMAMRRLGHKLTQDQFFALSGVDPGLGRGALAKELVRGLKRLGFETGRAWYRVSRRGPRRRAQLAAQFKKLHGDLLAGIPSIICTHYDARPRTTQHFRLVLGYDAKTDEVIYHEPAEDKGAYKRMPRRQMLALWPLPYIRTRDILVRIRLEPKEIKVPVRRRTASVSRHSPADFAQHVMKLRPTIKKLRGRFSIVVQPPFVVIGDSGRRDVRRTSKVLIERTVTSLKKLYFDKDPPHILNIWLFKGRRSYQTNTLRLIGERPGTPFGFYSSSKRALVMNIKTGGGTLVHELVHPFMEANFPNCPPWFNEGLGSLYEGVGWPGGRIWGYTNWRLPGLKKAIRAKRVPGFKRLMAQNELQFYNYDPGTNYSQSRYLVYYLQVKGLLRTYYHAFKKNHLKDPTGYETLKQVLKIEDMDAFKRRWEAYTLKLKYPPW